MGERIGLNAKKPDVNRYNSNLRMRRTNHSRSVNTLVDRILFLQRTVGNQAVQRLLRSGALQAKLMIGHPGDVYEQEADRIADTVMQMTGPYKFHIQRVCSECEEVDEEDTGQTGSETPTVPSPRGAVAVSVPAPEPTPLVSAGPGPEPVETPRHGRAHNVFRTIAATPKLQGMVQVTADMEERINALNCGGHPLSETERTYFEPRFGHDFSQVRLHTDTQAAEAAQAVNARAYTVGLDVVFGEGQYTPGLGEGRRLLAHELAHVVQQSNGIKYIQRDVILHNAGCPLETLDHTRNSNQIGALFGTPIAYGMTHFRTRTPGRKTVLGRMVAPNQGEIWISNATIFPVTEILMYLTNQFANGSCEYNWTFSHEITHWLGGCDKFERKLSFLQSDLQALPGPNNRQLVNGNQLVVEQARRDLETRVDTILRCFRIEVCREISRFNRRLDLQTYPQAFSSCRQPPQVPQVPPIATYLRTCNPPLLGCPRPIP